LQRQADVALGALAGVDRAQSLQRGPSLRHLAALFGQLVEQPDMLGDELAITPAQMGECEGDGRGSRGFRPDSATTVVFLHACKLGFEGIVSKRLGSRYRSGHSRDWLKFKNSAAPAVKSLTRVGHRPRSPAPTAAPRFRTIQVCPKDGLTVHRQTGDAANRLRHGGRWLV
jgi:hypothetical protein